MVVPATLLIIFILLYLTFQRLDEAALIMATLPFALAGGIWLLWLLGHNLSVAGDVGFIALAILGWRRLRTSYSIWVALLLFYTLISPAIAQADVLVSNQRFVLEMFPAFITLAALSVKHPRLHQGLLIAFPFLQATLAVLFVLNRWMV